MNPLRRLTIGAGVCAGALGATIACDSTQLGSVDGMLAIGTWGGSDAGVIVTDSLAHVHIGCTYGDIPGRIALNADGEFTVSGSYLQRAYPVAIGPTMPAQFHGKVAGAMLTYSVVVTDTIENKVTTLGPAVVRLGKDPQMGPCPICHTPGDRARARGELVGR